MRRSSWEFDICRFFVGFVDKQFLRSFVDLRRRSIFLQFSSTFDARRFLSIFIGFRRLSTFDVSSIFVDVLSTFDYFVDFLRRSILANGSSIFVDVRIWFSS